MNTNKKIIIITGPTASGKSDIAINIAKESGGEIICADSMQIYIGMDIGTAKTVLDEKQNIPHLMQDIISPNENYSVALYKENATNHINDIFRRGKVPIICGGTGQYISALTEGITFTEIKTDFALRTELDSEYEVKGKEFFYEYLKEIDPLTADVLHINDKKRILRAIEIYKTTGFAKSQLDSKSKENGPEFKFSGYCIYQERDILYERINNRVDVMIKKGLIQEVKKVLSQFPDISRTAMQAIGYKEFKQNFEGEISLNDAIDKIKQASRNYAKRQLTWFRKMENLNWIKNDNMDKTVKIILEENK